MFPTCEICFENNPMKVAYAGQWLRGTVHLNLTTEQDVCGIYICFEGAAKCRFKESDGNMRSTYSSTQKYLNEQRTYFVGDGDQRGTFRLLPGRYSYTFQCILPPNIPTSFSGRFGLICYKAVVVLDKPSKPRLEMWHSKFEMPFTVIHGINFNENPQLKEPVIVKKVFSSCFPLACPSTPNRIVARIPIRGYTPGQVIKVEINIENGSFQSMSEFSIKLVKQITYYSTERMKEKITVIKQKIKLGNDLAREKSIYVNMAVPSILPSDSTSDVIKFGYFIRIVGCVGLFNTNPVLDLPITIYSEPIHNELGDG